MNMRKGGGFRCSTKYMHVCQTKKKSQKDFHMGQGGKARLFKGPTELAT